MIELKEGFVQKNKDNDKLLFIRKYESLIADETTMIGEPIDFNDYKQQNFQNPKGSNKIIQKVSSEIEIPKKVKNFTIFMFFHFFSIFSCLFSFYHFFHFFFFFSFFLIYL